MTETGHSGNSGNNSKRNSIASKVATPRTTTPAGSNGGGAGVPGVGDSIQPAMDIEALRKAVGARLRLTTIAPDAQTFEGTVLVADPLTNLLALNTRIASAHTSSIIDPRIISFSRIQTFTILSSSATANGGASEASVLKMGSVDTKCLQQREDDKIAKLKEQERDRGSSVSKEGQAIYDALKRINIPLRWHESQIIAHERVIIMPPYRLEDCKAPKEAQDTLNRVKKALEGERKKLKLKQERGKPEAVEERKGG